MKKRSTSCFAAVLVLTTFSILLWQPVHAAGKTITTGAGAGAIPSGASLNGVPLTSLRFGIGVDIASNGLSSGDFQATLVGKNVLGQLQEIIVEGKSSAGSSASGSITFSGSCSLDMGDGTLPLQNVPFIAAVATGTDGKPTLALTVGATSLPPASISQGNIHVQ